VIGTWPKSGCRYMFDRTENRVSLWACFLWSSPFP
jgi:hypothetical protein